MRRPCSSIHAAPMLTGVFACGLPTEIVRSGEVVLTCKSGGARARSMSHTAVDLIAPPFVAQTRRMPAQFGSGLLAPTDRCVAVADFR